MKRQCYCPDCNRTYFRESDCGGEEVTMCCDGCHAQRMAKNHARDNAEPGRQSSSEEFEARTDLALLGVPGGKTSRVSRWRGK